LRAVVALQPGKRESRAMSATARLRHFALRKKDTINALNFSDPAEAEHR
jgi:hypothetical protein